MSRQQFFLGRETIDFCAKECAQGVLLEREWTSTNGRRGSPEIHQVTLATPENVDALLAGEVREDLIRPRLEQMIADLSSRTPPEEVSHFDDMRATVRAIRALKDAPDEGVLATQVLKVAKSLGGRNALFMLKSGKSASTAESSYRILTSAPEDIHAVRTYTEKHWFATDPFLIHACRSHEPCYTSDVGLLENLSGSWHEMGRFTRSLGMCSFAVHPSHAPRVDKVGALYVSNALLPSEQGEESLRENEVLLRALSNAVFDWYVSQDRYLALRDSGLDATELSILTSISRGETIDMACEHVGVSKPALRTKHSPAIRKKLGSKSIIEAARTADDRGLLAAVSERKVVYVIHSSKWGTYLREECGVPFWSGVNPGGLPFAQIFLDAASAKPVLDAQPPGHDCRLHRVEVHHTSRRASVEDCVAAGLPSWEDSSITSNSPADDTATWGEMAAPVRYH